MRQRRRVVVLIFGLIIAAPLLARAAYVLPDAVPNAQPILQRSSTTMANKTPPVKKHKKKAHKGG